MQNYRIQVVSALILLDLYYIGSLLALIITFPGNQSIGPGHHIATFTSLVGHEFIIYHTWTLNLDVLL